MFLLAANLQFTLTAGRAESFRDTALLWDRVRNGFREISQLPPSPQNHESALSSGPDDRKTLVFCPGRDADGLYLSYTDINMYLHALCQAFLPFPRGGTSNVETPLSSRQII